MQNEHLTHLEELKMSKSVRRCIVLVFLCKLKENLKEKLFFLMKPSFHQYQMFLETMESVSTSFISLMKF